MLLFLPHWRDGRKWFARMRRFQVAPTQAPPPAEWDAATDDQSGWIVGYPMVSHGIGHLRVAISLKRSPFGKVNSPVAYCLTIWNLHVLPFPSGCIPILIDDMVPIVGLHLMIFLSIIHTFLLVALPLLVLNLLSSNMWVCPNIGYISTWLLHCGKQISKPPNFGITYFQTNPDISWLSPVLSYSKIIEVPMTYFIGNLQFSQFHMFFFPERNQMRVAFSRTTRLPFQLKKRWACIAAPAKDLVLVDGSGHDLQDI